MNEKELIERYPELVTLREFATKEEIVEALQQGTLCFRTGISCGKPNECVEGPLVVAGDWHKDDIGRYVVVRHPKGYEDRIYLNDLQNSVAKAVFRTKKQADAYSQFCHAAYRGDEEWQAYVERGHTDTGESHINTERDFLPIRLK